METMPTFQGEEFVNLKLDVKKFIADESQNFFFCNDA